MMNSSMEPEPLQVTTFNSFQVNRVQSFDVNISNQFRPSDLQVSISSPPLGQIEKKLDWSNDSQQFSRSKCNVSFKAPVVGIYNIKVELTNLPQHQRINNCVEFQAKAYDLSKVFINRSYDKCRVGESYEFGVDASGAGEGQLEIAVNEGEIPNQVQVLDNGKCIVNFAPEEPGSHVVDIKFNGHNVINCPFVVYVEPAQTSPPQPSAGSSDVVGSAVIDTRRINKEPELIKNERVLVNSVASFTLENINLDQLDKKDVMVIDPENRPVEYSINRDPARSGNFRFEFKPATVGDYSVNLSSQGRLSGLLPQGVRDQFPFSLKVFDFNKVLVSDVTNGVVGHPVYFFIDASQAGSGNLEIRVSSKTQNVPNHPQSEANAKIRVYFEPTEASDHLIDVKFNGISVPNNPFLVKVSKYPQARLPITSRDLLKYVAVNETVEFTVEYLDNRPNELTSDSCKVSLLKPDFTCVTLDDIQLIRLQDKNDKCQALFKIKFKATLIGPYKLFVTVNNELLPKSPILTNVYNIHEVKVLFEQAEPNTTPVGKINEPVTFTVDASRAGEGILALAVVSSQSNNPVPTSVENSDKGHGLYNLSFIPTEFAVHSIDMSFNDRVVPSSPFIVDVLSSGGDSALALSNKQRTDEVSSDLNDSRNLGASANELAHDMSALSLKHSKPLGGKNKAPAAPLHSSPLSKEDEMFQSIVVHGVSLKRTPVNSTGAFIIETNQMAHARDFDVLIADPSNSLVDVQCYRDQAGNLIAEWTPARVGTHKIEVLYKNKPVPGSPFMSEAFDPSGVYVEALKSSQFMLGDLVELRINQKEAGLADLEVILTDPEGASQPIEVQRDRLSTNGSASDHDSAFELVSFSPKMPGKYRVTITFGGYEVPKSPLVLSVRDNREPVKVSGNGLRCAEVNRSALFNVESSSDGEMKLRIECGDREIVPKIEKKERSYAIKYKPTEIGYAIISLYWDGSHIDGSPFSVPVNDLTKFAFVHRNNASSSSSRNGQIATTSSQITLDYEPRLAREIILDTSACGPGELKAEAYCRANPIIKFSIPVNQVTTGRYKLIFTCPPGPEQLATGINLKDFPVEATYLIRFYYNNLAVPETLASVCLSPSSRSAATLNSDKLESTAAAGALPASTLSSRENGTREQNNNLKSAAPTTMMDRHKSEVLQRQAGEVVALRGHGLVEVNCGEVGEFTIDGRSVRHGSPQVKLFCLNDEVKVHLELMEENLYKATYVAHAEGEYTLNVMWDGKQVAGCPITVNVLPGCDSSKVICTADSLKGGVLGEEIKTFIDTRKAGPGELTALCTGPRKVAFCELLDRGDGTFVLYIKPQESGRHFLTINYGGQHIPKSPFSFKVSGKPDPTKVRVYGPGVDHGVLSLYQSRFMCDTRGAGAGQLTVRIRGPKGAFRMETERANQRDRTILCKYDPTEPGDYRIEIKWSGRHVPGSPFSVMIFDTQEELNRFLLSRQKQQAVAGSHNGVSASATKKHSSSAGALDGSAHQLPPFQPTLVEYGQYPGNLASAAGPQHQQQSQQSPFRLQ